MLAKAFFSIVAGVATLASASAFAQTYAQTVDTFTPANPAVIHPSAVELRRSPAGVELSARLTGLTPNGAYSAWWVIFNSPNRCTAPCGMDDIGAGVGQVFNATGYVSDGSGTANVVASLARGPIPIGVDRRSQSNPALNPASEVGLRQPFTAEIHVIVARHHGPAITGRMDEQTTAFLGGCDVFACADQQAAVFLPVRVRE
ncbi:MAG: hypothetical protein U5J99_08705 [Parvularculaceae bacterium]|nr:hypothetical protein [Parvularculaceae bacterium]